MTTAAEMKRRLQALNVEEIVTGSIEQTASVYVEENNLQMGEGKTADQTDIVPLYAPRTARRKGRDVPNLYETGDFYGSRTLKVEKETLVNDSGVEYEKHLVKRYTDRIYGLGGIHAERYTGVLQPVIVEKIKENTGLQ